MSRAPKREFLDAIAGRAGLFECILGGETDKRALERRLSISRSTINRWLSDLQKADIIAEHGNGYHLTLSGRLAYQEYDRFDDRFSAIFNAKPVLRYLPDDVSIDMRLLVDAEIILSSEIAPQEPVLRLEDMVLKAETRTFQGISPVILPRYVEFFHAQIVNNGLEAEFVLEAEVMDYLISANRDDVAEIIESEGGTLARLQTMGLPFGLGIVDDEGVWVGVHEPGGGFRGAIINTSAAALEWAQELFAEIRNRADVIEKKDLLYRGVVE